ncbi:MAG: PilZ domain-containing protein [Lachnospiraceae bacterium]|nr:PilZ domain-containing protein [Lachnospiraceae bacterium]
MLIEELEVGTPISFLVDIGGAEPQHLEFSSHIEESYPKKKMAIAEAVMRDDKIVSFKGENTVVNVIALFSDDKPQIFNNVTVTSMKRSNNTFCYSLQCTAAGKPFNRRGSYRCYVGLPTSLAYKPGAEPVEVIIKDVSVSGFALTCPSEIELAINQVVHVVLTDTIEQSGDTFTFQMYGIVVRSQDLENGKIVYGCKLNNHVGGLENYVALKERMNLKKDR